MNRKKLVFLLIMASAVSAGFSQQSQRTPFPLIGWSSYQGVGSTMTFRVEGLGVRVSGAASAVEGKGGAGYVVENEDLEMSGKRLLLRVSGIDTEPGPDRFSVGRLLKLEINNRVLRTTSPGMQNTRDRNYINAVNSDFVFDISGINQIKKINLVFFGCTVANVKLELFVE